MNKEEMQKYIEALEKERDHNAMNDDISEIKRLANRIKQYADCWPDEPNEEVKK